MNRTTHGGSERVVMLQTKFTELLGCTVPLQQAGMGKIASPALATAVAKAGGLGMVSGIGAAPPEYVARVLDGLRRSTSGVFGANFIVAGARDETSGKLDPDFPKVLGVAAGGIGAGRAMGAALAAGAAAVRVGTRFVASEEAGALPAYVDKLIAADAKDTILTEAFSTNWPNAPHRVLRSCVKAVERFQGDVVGETAQPWAPEVGVPLRRGDSIVADRTTTRESGAMPLRAGESVGGVKRLQPAGEIVRELADEAEALLRTWGT